MDYCIYYEDDSIEKEIESRERGYRNDVTVAIGTKDYSLYITDIIRLHQDVDTEFCDSGYYLNMPNTIIVKEVTKEEIEKTIHNLFMENFFEKLGGVERKNNILFD